MLQWTLELFCPTDAAEFFFYHASEHPYANILRLGNERKIHLNKFSENMQGSFFKIRFVETCSGSF